MQDAAPSVLASAAAPAGGGLTLGAWMEAQGLKDADVADKAGCSDVTVYRVRTGRAKPSFDLIEKLIALSDGAVDGNSFFKRALGKAAASREGTPRGPFNSRSSCPKGTSAARPPRLHRPPATSSPASPDREASPPSSAKRSSR